MHGRSMLAAVLLAGCATSVPAPRTAAGTAAGTLEGTEWRLTELAGQPAHDPTPTLHLDAAQRRASGSTGCNSFFGPYELRGDSLRFGELASTRRACLDPEANRQERAYLDALGGTRSWRLAEATLVLSGEPGELARFSTR